MQIVGTAIPESDILAMFVWIPRYMYNIPTANYHTGTEGTIGIKFLKGTTNIATDGSNVTISNVSGGNNWLVHPSFIADTAKGGVGQELTGFWVGKFESSSTNPATGTACGGGNTTALNVKIIPNVTSWRKIDITNIFTVCQEMNGTGNIHGLTNTIDTTAMKNSQWGACSYLAQSDHGNKQVSTDDSSGIWSNSYHNGDNYYGTLTGVVGESRDATSTNGTETAIYYLYNTENGVKGSTTRNIYGIYDMSGGAWEYTVSYLNEISNTYTKILDSKDEKYVTKYVGDSSDRKINYNANSQMYGDAIYETSEVGDSTLRGWNRDSTGFTDGSGQFFVRGQRFSASDDTGVFCFSRCNGNENSSRGFRVVAF